MGFFNIFGQAEIHKFPKYGKSEFSQYGKNMGKNKHSKVVGFLNILGEAEVHIWEKWIYLVPEKYGNIFLATLQIKRKWEPMHFSMFANVKIPVKWKYSMESHIISRLWVFEEIRKFLR